MASKYIQTRDIAQSYDGVALSKKQQKASDKYKVDSAELVDSLKNLMSLQSTISAFYDRQELVSEGYIIQEPDDDFSFSDMRQLRNQEELNKEAARKLIINLARKYNIKIHKDHRGVAVSLGKEHFPMVLDLLDSGVSAELATRTINEGSLNSIPIVTLTCLSVLIPYKIKYDEKFIKQMEQQLAKIDKSCFDYTKKEMTCNLKSAHIKKLKLLQSKLENFEEKYFAS